MENNITDFSIEIVTPHIGGGSFGNIYRVFLCKNEYPINVKIEAAMKVIPYSRNEGLLCLLEPYIMKYINHPHLMSSFKVEITKSYNLQIFESLADCDVATFIKNKNKISKKNYNENEYILKKWCWQILCAVATLHSHGIIHGDIKSSNILVFNMNDIISSFVKLTDYGLSTIIMDPFVSKKINGIHLPYTQSHRAPEVWKKEMWSFTSDIWALGCTFYELKYHHLLFPDQKGYPFLEKSNLECMQFWKRKISKEKFEDQSNIFSNFNPPDNNIMWDDPLNLEFNDLIIKMLEYNPNDRINIWDIYNHPYFNSISLEERNLFPIIEKQYYPIIEKKLIYDNKWAEIFTFTGDSEVSSLAVSLYNRAQQQFSIESCIRLSNKLLYNRLSNSFSKISFRQFQEEIQLCNKLNFKFLED